MAGEVAPGASEFGACYDVATEIWSQMAGAKLTVAYVPEPIRGFAVLPILACSEIVMGPESSLGPIAIEGRPYDPALRENVRMLAIRKARSPELLIGMLDRDADTIEAIATSTVTLWSNPGAMLVWAITIAVLIGASLVFFLPLLALTAPLVGHTTWKIYKALVPAGAPSAVAGPDVAAPQNGMS